MKYISFRIKKNFHQDDVLDKNMKTELSPCSASWLSDSLQEIIMCTYSTMTSFD